MVFDCQSFPGKTNMKNGTAQLSPREQDIVRRLAQGLSLKEIARELGTAHSTVRKQVMGAREKMGCRSNAEMVVKARRAG